MVKIVPKRNPKTIERLVNSMLANICLGRTVVISVAVVVVVGKLVRISRQYLSVPNDDRIKSKQT